jgi:YegS/Rv2252/BmrU family lipid kinase
MQTDSLSLHFAFIINPIAGRRLGAHVEQRIKRLFDPGPRHHTCEIMLTDRNGHARELAAGLAASHGSRLVAVACGGDGTAQEVANGLAGTAAAMTILPLGTGNDFARTAFSNPDVDWLIAHLGEPDIRTIDVIRVDGRICLNITSLGFDTKVQRKASFLAARSPWLGSFSYPLAIVAALFGKRDYSMHYQLQTVDGQGQPGQIEADARFILAAICNGRFYGGGFNPAPQASLDDGVLDFCLVDSLPLSRVLALIPLYKKGRHLGDPAVHTHRVTAGRITATAGLLLGNYDGEIFEVPSITFSVWPQALRFAFY